jgi:hypothetical protein
MFWTLYVYELGFLDMSPALVANTKDKINFAHYYSQMEQLPFMESVCLHSEIFT